MCKKNPYSFIGATYQTNKQITLDSNCNGITVVNKGLTTITFNGIPLLPSLVVGQTGESFSMGGNIGEILTSRLDLSFEPGAGSNALIIQKFYTCQI
jgi:hypothetical protein